MISSSQVNVSWTTSTDNVGVTGYQISRCTTTSCSPFDLIAVTGTSYNDTGRAPNTYYSYRVRARDAAANYSNYSNTAAVTTPAATDTTAPSTPSVTATVISSSQVNVSWTTSTDNVGVTGLVSSNVRRPYLPQRSPPALYLLLGEALQ